MSRFQLDWLRLRFDAQAARLEAILATERAGGDPERITVASEYCVIHLQDCWNRFVRDLVMRSSLGGAVRASGARLPPGPRGHLWERDAFDYLRLNWGRTMQKQLWEPDWHETSHASRAIDVLRPPNGNDLKTAFGASANPITEVRPVRNFVAHRGRRTAASIEPVARHYAGPDWRQPRDILNVVIPGSGGVVVFEEWCRRFRAVAAAAVN
jgi:hypothetical protein